MFHSAEEGICPLYTGGFKLKQWNNFLIMKGIKQWNSWPLNSISNKYWTTIGLLWSEDSCLVQKVGQEEPSNSMVL